MKKLSFLLGIIVIVLFACSKSSPATTPPALDCGTAKTFSGDVAPIIASSCATGGCHAAGSVNGPGALTNYTQIFNSRASIRSSVASGSMPKGSSLSTAQKNAILCWVDAGAPNN